MDLDGQTNLTTGGDFTQRSVVGGSISAFYGLEIAGVYQTSEEVAADPAAIAANAGGQFVAPGDFMMLLVRSTIFGSQKPIWPSTRDHRSL